MPLCLLLPKSQRSQRLPVRSQLLVRTWCGCEQWPDWDESTSLSTGCNLQLSIGSFCNFQKYWRAHITTQYRAEKCPIQVCRSAGEDTWRGWWCSACKAEQAHESALPWRNYNPVCPSSIFCVQDYGNTGLNTQTGFRSRRSYTFGKLEDHFKNTHLEPTVFNNTNFFDCVGNKNWSGENHSKDRRNYNVTVCSNSAWKMLINLTSNRLLDNEFLLPSTKSIFRHIFEAWQIGNMYGNNNWCCLVWFITGGFLLSLPPILYCYFVTGFLRWKIRWCGLAVGKVWHWGASTGGNW